MKFYVFALLSFAFVPVFLSAEGKPSSLRELISDKMSLGFDPSPHIINGPFVARNALPYMAFLNVVYTPKLKDICGGALIHPEWVLTAAHCVANARTVSVTMGAHDRGLLELSTTQGRIVNKIFLEKNYTTSQTDIALLKLDKPITINQFVQTVRLPAKSMVANNLTGTSADVSGWGRWATPDRGNSYTLRKATTTIISNEDCKKAGLSQAVRDWRICALGLNNTSACNGDSGGPLVITEPDGQKTVVGIVAIGVEGCDPKYPGAYTRVDSFLDWISDTAGITLRP